MRKLQARDVMTTAVVTARKDASVIEVARLLTRYHLSGVPIVDDGGRVLGVISEADLLLKEAGGAAVPRLALFWQRFRTGSMKERLRRYEGRTAGDLMTTNVVTAVEDTPLYEVANRMGTCNVNRVPIVRDGVLVGIVTRNDIIKAFLRPAMEMLAAAQEAIGKIADTTELTMDVRDGVLFVEGTIARVADAKAIDRAGHSVDGIVAVDTSGLVVAGQTPSRTH